MRTLELDERFKPRLRRLQPSKEFDPVKKEGSGWEIWGAATKIMHTYREGQPNVESNGGRFLLGSFDLELDMTAFTADLNKSP